jgi:penicillin-binding protein 1A
MDTCGKTGSADDNKDRWFVGYTPYYSAAVWVGYDDPRVISYGGVNPALTIWRAVMNKIHKELPGKTFSQPEAVKRAYVCCVNPKFATSTCSGVTDFVNTNIITGYCSGDHSNTIGTPGILEEEKVKDPAEDGENAEGEDETSENGEGTLENGEDTQNGQTSPSENTSDQSGTVSQEQLQN